MVLPPKIDMINPSNDISYINTTLNIQGKVTRAKYLTINGRPILFDESGRFEHLMILEPGRNEITINAKSQLKKEAEIVRTVIYQAENKN